MVNTNVAAPFGFQQVGTTSGPVNFMSDSNPPWVIASNYSTPIFYGDLVTLTSSSDTGYIIQSSAGDTTIPHVGVFYGCKYYSTGQRKTVWNNFWPGADATGDVTAFICTDPNALFKCQAGATTTLTRAVALGKLVDIVVGSGNTTTGISGSYLAAVSTQTTTLPFKIVNVVTDPPGANGTDLNTGGYNYVIVTPNFWMNKTNVGQP